MSATVLPTQQDQVRPSLKTPARQKPSATGLPTRQDQARSQHNPELVAPVGRTVWDIVVHILTALKRPAVGIPVLISAIGGIVLLGTLGQIQVSYVKDNLMVEIGGSALPSTPAPVNVAGSRLEKNIAAGKELKRPYILDHVTVLIKIDDTKSRTIEKREVKWRIVYTIRALEPISKTDKLFKERYSSAYAQMRRWFGTEKEVNSTDDAYNVMFDIPAGDTRTIVTGATFSYDLPLKDNREAFGQRIYLTSDQEFFSYPNEEDVIGELTILIESDSLKITSIGQAAKRCKPNGSTAPDDDVRFNSEGQRSMSARWVDVMPNEEVGIHFRIESL